MKHRYGCNIPIQTIGLQLYDVDGCDPETSPVQRVQWLAYGTGPGQVLLQGHRILIVDEVCGGGERYVTCYTT
jgi:hypoxanthine phosphoribosyltransferase